MVRLGPPGGYNKLYFHEVCHADCPLVPSLRLLSTGFQDEGEGVFLDGVKDITLRSQLAAFLNALGLATPAISNISGPTGAPREFRCSQGGGGVLHGVASLMDEIGMVYPPPLRKEAAFETAKEASLLHHKSIVEKMHQFPRIC